VLGERVECNHERLVVAGLDFSSLWLQVLRSIHLQFDCKNIFSTLFFFFKLENLSTLFFEFVPLYLCLFVFVLVFVCLVLRACTCNVPVSRIEHTSYLIPMVPQQLYHYQISRI